MASLRERHSRGCALKGAESRAGRAGCTCRPTYSIRIHRGNNVYVSQKVTAAARNNMDLARRELERFHAFEFGDRPGYKTPPVDVYIAESLLGSPLVKIGISVNVRQRMNDLKARPLLVFTGGGRELEQRLHDRFAHLREVGEWFRREGELADLLQAGGL